MQDIINNVEYNSVEIKQWWKYNGNVIYWYDREKTLQTLEVLSEDEQNKKMAGIKINPSSIVKAERYNNTITIHTEDGKFYILADCDIPERTTLHECDDKIKDYCEGRDVVCMSRLELYQEFYEVDDEKVTIKDENVID